MNDSINILIDFEMLFNLDYGLIKTIVLKYNNSKYTNDSYLKSVQFDDLMHDLLNQEKDDPLQLVFKDGVDYKDIYNQLYKNEIEEIVKHSCPTKIVGLMTELMKYNNNNNIMVICKNRYEEQKIRSMHLLTKTVNINDINNLVYDCYYCKDIKRINMFKEIDRKYIYIANYKYNIIELEENKELSSKLFLNNLDLIQIY